MLLFFTVLLIFVQPIFCKECFVPGKCVNNGAPYYGETVSSVEDCIALCYKGNNCKWSTYHSSNGLCELYEKGCDEVDYMICPFCLNNERSCISGKFNVQINIYSVVTLVLAKRLEIPRSHI